MLLGTLGASLLGSLLTGKGAIATTQWPGVYRAGKGKGIVRAGYGKNRVFKYKTSLANFAIQKYYQNESRFNGVYSRYNLPKIKDGAYIINLDEYSDIGTHWVALHVNNNNVTYFDSFGVEHIPKEIKTFINNKNIKTNIFRIQAYDSVMCRYFYIGFIDFIFKGKTLTEYTNLFSPNNFEKSDDIILKYFMNNT